MSSSSSTSSASVSFESMSSSLSLSTGNNGDYETASTTRPSSLRTIEEVASNYTRQNCDILGTKSVGVDYGVVRTGVAITVGFNPKPLDIISINVNDDRMTLENDTGGNDPEMEGTEDFPSFDKYFLELSSRIPIDHLATQFPLPDENDNNDENRDFDNSNSIDRDVDVQQVQNRRHAQRLRILQRHQQEVARRVIDICRRERDVKRIVVGLPLHKNGTSADQSMICRLFAMEVAKQSLQEFGPVISSLSSTTSNLSSLSSSSSSGFSSLSSYTPNVEVWLWDERYTSKEAAARAHSANPNQGLYGMLDADAACIILEHFYNDHISAQQQQQQLQKNVTKINDNFVSAANGELVTVQDPDIVRQYTEQWVERQHQQQMQLHQASEDRDARLLLRKQRIEEDRKREQEQEEERRKMVGSLNDASSSMKKKKKRKKRKKK